MEFSRRGPATEGAAGSHRCPDPPPHGDAMLVMRDALLWQLQKVRLRQEIIVAELTKIECAMALHAASSIRTMPMPWDSMPQCKEPVFNWEPKHHGDLGEGHDGKLPKNDGRQSAESRFWKPVVEDCADECSNPSKCKCNVGQEKTTFDVPELGDSDETVLSNKSSQAVKWELTGITIPVKKPKRPMKWSCDVCQEQVSIKKVIRKHCAGKKHRSNIAILESRIKAIGDQKVKTVAEPSLGTDQIKTSSIKWNCSTCQDNGTCQSDLEEHLNGTRHLQNIAASCKGGSNHDTVTNIALQEEKLDEHNVPQHAENPPSVWGCSNCRVICSLESDVEIHVKGKRNLKKIQALLKRRKNKQMNIESQKANLNLESVLQHVDKTDCELDTESHLRAETHQPTVLAHCRNINQEENNPSKLAKDQIPSSGWDCAMCQAKCISEAHFKNHCTSRKHQLKMKVMRAEGDIAKTASLETADELLSDGLNSKNELHSDGTAHQQNIAASCKEGSKSDMVKNMEPHEANLHERNVSQHGELNMESHLRAKRHQPNVLALCRNINQEENNPSKLAKDQTPSSRWDCAMCQAKCISEAHFKNHCTSRKHQLKMKVMRAEGDIAKTASLETADELLFDGLNSKNELHSDGTAHQQNIAASCKEGSKSDMAKNIEPHEANLHERSVSQHAAKPPLVGCSICQVICGRESDLEIHLNGKRHIKKIRALLEESENKAVESGSQKANLNLDSMPQPAEKANCGLDLESHLRDGRLQLMNDQGLREKINQDENNPPEIASDLIPSSEWDCVMCKAKIYSEAQFEHHCTSRKHQRKINVTLGEGDSAKVSSLHIEVPYKEGSNSDMVKNIGAQEAKSHKGNVPGNAEKPLLVGCSICQVMCGRESDLEIHLKGKRHLKEMRALLEESKNKAMNSESQKANLNPDSVPQPAEITNCKLDLESDIGEERLHLMNDRALHENINQDKNNPPELAKDQVPSSGWDCAMCQAKCNSSVQFENHCLSRKHQRKTQVILGKDDNAKTGCLETLDDTCGRLE